MLAQEFPSARICIGKDLDIERSKGDQDRDSSVQSMAQMLAQEFPSARICIGKDLDIERSKGDQDRDSSVQSMAQMLAQEFPSARICIGAPDQQLLQHTSPSQDPYEDRSTDEWLERSMSRLKQLIEKDRIPKR
eukprot:TRINITY_DN99633_c0_g1_i1.p1 TRINITY_DN99633_c0_g1~~TRINITY_DN99633_c0_g1_i1.p1  ORF type:complete len:134 (-),score=23.92 TRINITY_DN99633_c0_g1_i1:192-593(-)